MKYIYLIITMFFAVTSYAQTAMTTSEINTFKSYISSASKNIKSIQSDFVQTKKMSFMDKSMVTNGTLHLKNPNLLSWKYTNPYNYTVIFKNKKIYINDQGKKSTTDAKSKNFDKLSNMIAGSANGAIFNDPEFTVRYLKSGTTTIAQFTPKSSTLKKYIKQIDLHFLKNTATPSQIKMTESSGDFTQIVFKNTKTNVSIPDSIFTP